MVAGAQPGPQRRRGPGAGYLPRHDRAVRFHPARRLRVPQYPHAWRRLQPRVLTRRVGPRPRIPGDPHTSPPTPHTPLPKPRSPCGLCYRPRPAMPPHRTGGGRGEPAVPALGGLPTPLPPPPQVPGCCPLRERLARPRWGEGLQEPRQALPGAGGEAGKPPQLFAWGCRARHDVFLMTWCARWRGGGAPREVWGSSGGGGSGFSPGRGGRQGWDAPQPDCTVPACSRLYRAVKPSAWGFVPG